MRFTLNGTPVDVRAQPMARLLDVLREELRLTGSKEGCGEGECGACTVIVDGEAVNACLVPVAHVEGRAVTTIEGLRGHERLQEAFVLEGGAQCGICTPGMVLAASVLPADATLEEIREGLAGNLCRCTGYEGIYRAVRAARRPAGDQPASASRDAGAPDGLGLVTSAAASDTRAHPADVPRHTDRGARERAS